MTNDITPPDSHRRGMGTRSLGYAAAGLQLTLAVGLMGLVNAVRTSPEPPEPVDRGLALALIYALPAVIGALGAWAGRRSLLVAAAVACGVGSVLSFSGVTLLFLAPALLFTVAAARTRASRDPTRGAAAHSNPVAGLALAVLLAGLMVSAGVSLLALTEPRCWIAEQSASGLVYRIVPSIDGVSVQGAGASAGCSSAVLTPWGGVVAAILGLGAVAIAATAVLPRRRPGAVDILFIQLGGTGRG